MAKSKEMEIAIKIAGKVGGSFKSALKVATKGIKGITKAMGAATVGAASAVGAIGIAAINTGKEFEGAMSQVAATMLLDKETEKGQKAFETLENAARECGASTAFSATEAAEALNYLALAGYDADKAATALPTVLKLAGAGAMELAEASDMVTDSMSALGIEATEKNLTDFADKLAKTASKSNTSVAQLGEAILTVGGTAQGLAGETTELNTALGILADNGIKAAEGGTHLRNMILSLQSPRNSDAAELFKNLGLSAYDSEGKMRSLGDVFGDLNASLQGASAEKVNSVLSTIFKQTDLASARAMLAATVDSVENLGSVMDASLAESGTSIAALGINLEDMVANFDKTATQEQFAAQMMEQFGLSSEQAGTLFTGLQSIVNGTGNRFLELTKEIENSKGACEDMYAIQLDNLDGDIAILKSGLSDLGISIYKDLNGPLREMTQLGSSMVGKLSEAYKNGGMEGMVSAVGECLAEVVNVINEYIPKLINMGVKLLQSLIEGLVANSSEMAAASGEAVSAFVNGIFTLVPQVILAGIDICLQLAQGITTQLPQLINNGTQAIINFVAGILQRLPEIINSAITVVQTLGDSLGANVPMLLAAAIQLIGGLLNGILQMLPSLIQMGLQLVVSLIQGIALNLPLLLQMAVQMIMNLIQGLVQLLPMLLQSGIQIILSLIQGILQNLPSILTAAYEIVGALISGLIQAIPQLMNGLQQLVLTICKFFDETDWVQLGIDIIKGIIDGLISMGKNIWDTIASLFMGKEPPDMSATGTQAAASYATGLGNSASTVNNAVSTLSTTAFHDMDLTGATTAGTQAGTAFSTGLGDSLTNGSLDVSAFNNGMTEIGTTGATALGEGLDTGLAGVEVNPETFATNLTTIGTEGATAISEGMTSNAQVVTDAATELETGINTSFDSGWQKTQANAQGEIGRAHV